MAGVQGDLAAQVRAFGHDAVTVQTDARVIWLDLTSLTKGSGYSRRSGYNYYWCYI